MSDEELKNWFWKMFNSCYYVKHDDYPESVFMYYDVNFIRKAKFKILQGEEIVYPVKLSGVCIFEMDYKNEWLWCNYNHVWAYIESNSNHNYQETKDLVKGWLEVDTKLKFLTPETLVMLKKLKLDVDTKLKFLTPNIYRVNLEHILLDELKLKVLQI